MRTIEPKKNAKNVLVNAITLKGIDISGPGNNTIKDSVYIFVPFKKIN